MTFVLLLLALAAGVANPFQSGTNAQLNKQLASPLWATGIVYAMGFSLVLAVQLFWRQPMPAAKFGSVQWWAWLGAPISLISTVIGLVIAQKLGSTLFTGATITASLITSVLLDQFGLIGFKQHTASPARLAGCALMVAGLWLVAKF